MACVEIQWALCLIFLFGMCCVAASLMNSLTVIQASYGPWFSKCKPSKRFRTLAAICGGIFCRSNLFGTVGLLMLFNLSFSLVIRSSWSVPQSALGRVHALLTVLILIFEKPPQNLTYTLIKE